MCLSRASVELYSIEALLSFRGTRIYPPAYPKKQNLFYLKYPTTS
jgi:hypothetical protein